MLTNCPKKQKRLGCTVRGFNQLTWNDYSTKIVRQRNYNKQNQNPSILNKLHATMGTTLVEASLHDCTWGIGLRESDQRSQRQETWLGQNKLGQILAELREEIFLKLQTLAVNSRAPDFQCLAI